MNRFSYTQRHVQQQGQFPAGVTFSRTLGLFTITMIGVDGSGG